MITKGKSKKESLRRRAEKLLSKKFTTTPRIQDKDIKALIHELQVHQIELEMQNQELRRAQAGIEESRTKYSDLYDFSPVGYFTFNQVGEILEVNLTGTSLLGVDRSLLLRTPFSTFVDPEFRSLFRDHRLKVLRRGGKERCELKLIKKGGMPFYASLESIPIPHGKTFRIRSVVGDITELRKAQEKAETEHAFRFAIENSILSGIAAVDLKGRLSYVNPGFCRMVGRSEEELVGAEPPLAFSPPEEMDRNKRAFYTMMNGKSPRDGIELRFMRKNGERFDAWVVPSQLKDPKGNVIGWIGTFGDITHLKQMENELRELNTKLEEHVRQRTAELEAANQQLKQEITERKRAEKKSERLRVETENERGRLEAVMEALPVGVSVTDAQGGNIRANSAFEQIWGSPRPATASVSDYAAYKAWWTDTGKPVNPEEWASAQAVQKGQAVVGQMIEIQRFDGSRASVINSAAPVLGAHGQIIGSAVAIQDITAHREAEMKYSKILATALSGFWITDLQGKLLEVNDALCRMLGYTHEELLNLSISDIEAAENPADVLTHIAALRQKKFDYFVSRHRRKDGSFIDVEVNSTWLDIGEGQLVGFMQDITERKRIEEALRKSRDELEIRVEERAKEVREQSKVLDSFFKWSTTPFVILDRDFNFVRVNEAYAKACHREVTEFLGHNHFEFYPSNAMAIFEQVVQTKEPYVAVARPFSFPDHPEWGTSYWDWILTPILDNAGEVEYLVFSLEDVTDHKRADEAIKAERKRFYDVLEMLPAYVVLLTPDYHVSFANRFFRERFGESHSKRCFEYLFGRTEPCEVCETFTVLRTGAPHKWEWTGPDGRIYDVTDFPFTDTDGSTLIMEMGIDVTERKRAEEALKAAHQYTRSLIEASLDPLVTISAEGKIMDVNTATELATGVLRRQLIGSDFFDYFTEPEKAREGYRRVFETGLVRDYPLAIRDTSGRIIDVLYNATVYRNEGGEVEGVFAAARDITEQKRAEEALKQSETRLRALSSQLLTAQETERKRIAMELHDSVGQMLTAIKFKTENYVQEKGKKRGEDESLEVIISLIKETIEEVRRMQMDLHPSTLDDLGVLATLGWFCREYQKIYSHIRVEKEIAIQENEVSTPLKVVLYRLTQEAMNNIAKHSQANLVRLTLRKQKTQLEWMIEDNGTGFDLEKFFSSEGAKRGLGLSSMRERAELSGGKFVVESTQGKGTILRANWPL
jgi:PAS domain S-box-containing protein